MLHLILQLLLGLERQVPDNSRLASSLLILGAWFLLITEFFPRLAGPWTGWRWQDGSLWGLPPMSICAGNFGGGKRSGQQGKDWAILRGKFAKEL